MQEFQPNTRSIGEGAGVSALDQEQELIFQ